MTNKLINSMRGAAIGNKSQITHFKHRSMPVHVDRYIVTPIRDRQASGCGLIHSQDVDGFRIRFDGENVRRCSHQPT